MVGLAVCPIPGCRHMIRYSSEKKMKWELQRHLLEQHVDDIDKMSRDG